MVLPSGCLYVPFIRRLALPVPDLKPWHIIPVPPPVRPSGTGAELAESIPRTTKSGVIGMLATSCRKPS